MNKDVIAYDFKYYERAIEKLYKDHYKKRLIFLVILLGLEIFVALFSSWTWLNSIIALIIISGIGYMLKELKNFPLFIEREKDLANLVHFSEDKASYYITEENLTLTKKSARNLPSKEKGITFFIGVEPFKVMNPIHIRYYDMLELSYTDKFKQDKASVSYTKSRWKYRIKSWLRALPLVFVFIYIFGFRLSFIWVVIKDIFSSIF